MRKDRKNLGLVLAYPLIWVFSLVFFWAFTSGSDAMGYSLLFIWILNPVAIFAVSLLIGKHATQRRHAWLIPIAFGIAYALVPYLTFSLANTLAFGNVHMPDAGTTIVGAVISAAGLSLGAMLSRSAAYDPSDYDRPDGFPVDVCIFALAEQSGDGSHQFEPEQELKVLLIKRQTYDNRPEYPHQGKWALPGGFSNRDEDLDNAALRELSEETNVEGVPIEQFGTVYYPGRDVRDGKSRWLPTTIYVAVVEERMLHMIHAGDDAAEACLFSIEELREMDLAFDHKNILFGFPEKSGNLRKGTLAFAQEKVTETRSSI